MSHISFVYVTNANFLVEVSVTREHARNSGNTISADTITRKWFLGNLISMASHRVDKRHKWRIFAIASANVRSTCGNMQCHRQKIGYLTSNLLRKNITYYTFYEIITYLATFCIMYTTILLSYTQIIQILQVFTILLLINCGHSYYLQVSDILFYLLNLCKLWEL